MGSFAKACECKQFMEKVLHLIFHLKEHSWTSVNSFIEDRMSPKDEDHKLQNC